ncbi:hydroxyisourate hydrolase [Sphingomonas sp.]|uniref:hydroxyisourate hydrolase n=1 Tax=Sphingomonas sp. TaxID=28214 RepID=UPI001B197A41|nr:hydroxyisourate hydrolase [Sphingomonas sp.]MBO9713228.1 hydroxyisourate hydrolase [Sphingomonas sp.]
MTSLSTHVLDTAHGRPAAGVKVRLWHDGSLLFSGATNDDGRCPELIADKPLTPGTYTLEFSIADYFRGLGIALADPPFLDLVAIEFGIAEAGGHYHVPLLVSPYGYSTYRGS